jgi:chromosome segregation ATPase
MENSVPLIHGFSLAGYRSFGPNLQRFGPCSKINLIVGQNNSGKSNVLRFICTKYNELAASRAFHAGRAFGDTGRDV